MFWRNYVKKRVHIWMRITSVHAGRISIKLLAIGRYMLDYLGIIYLYVNQYFEVPVKLMTNHSSDAFSQR